MHHVPDLAHLVSPALAEALAAAAAAVAVPRAPPPAAGGAAGVSGVRKKADAREGVGSEAVVAVVVVVSDLSPKLTSLLPSSSLPVERHRRQRDMHTGKCILGTFNVLPCGHLLRSPYCATLVIGD